MFNLILRIEFTEYRRAIVKKKHFIQNIETKGILSDKNVKMSK